MDVGCNVTGISVRTYTAMALQMVRHEGPMARRRRVSWVAMYLDMSNAKFHVFSAM